VTSVPIVPADFVVPLELLTEHALLRPLGAEHNVADYSAWTSSLDHIESTPGFGPPRDWPDPEMSLADNLADMQMHRRHFHERVGFTYTVLDRVDPAQVVGCIYIYPDPAEVADVEVRSWVVADRPELDLEIYEAVTEWLQAEWPFNSARYAPR